MVNDIKLEKYVIFWTSNSKKFIYIIVLLTFAKFEKFQIFTKWHFCKKTL